MAHSLWNTRGTAFLVLLLLSLPHSAVGLHLELQSQSQPHPGIIVHHYKVFNPKMQLWAVYADLCAPYVHVTTTDNPSGLQTAASWAQSEGVQIAVNGDFYKLSPLHVYGKAVAEGMPWPSVKQGIDASYQDEWFYKKFGWIGFGHDRVDFSHSRWVKKNIAGLASGWHPGSVVTTHPAGTLSLVSGFSELVIEGEQVTCSSPTASDCFPDRSDMRDRHPRTAMGFTEDRQTFILVVVDGRTSSSVGVYGAELAEIMYKVGAWEAVNLDGGGSSQLWVQGQGTVNNAVGNNNGSGLRAVANHWGIFAGPGSGMPERPGHCVSQPPCGVLGPGGGMVDDDGPCFRTFGPPEYWHVESDGVGGSLHWTNAWETDIPSNWAWWRLHFEEGGEYLVEFHATPEFAVWSQTHYEVRASGSSHVLSVDQSQADGWTELGSWTFTAGGEQWVAVYDDVDGSVGANQHVIADAVRLTRLDPWCGDGECNGPEDCMTCGADCGSCGPVCGDGECTGDEVCALCPEDCGECPEPCGDGACQSTEDCVSCPEDCGECPHPCGDGECGMGEDCQNCPDDCGACPVEPVPDIVAADAAQPAEDVLSPGDEAGAVSDNGVPPDVGAPAVDSLAQDDQPSSGPAGADVLPGSSRSGGCSSAHTGESPLPFLLLLVMALGWGGVVRRRSGRWTGA